ncbi:hypothetical protein [Fictibacillus fluitans]|uniref:Uncharacterized protein n=1 Tax=Fictibacillus fluitans TaxID=3058422 RepID=A0ABT8HW99_9BACL|nr:hypothetical protein [Fictibacillus sp. NE201]MDN4525057.1 hypothetical protein [Fictibacillus sp. NE201]
MWLLILLVVIIGFAILIDWKRKRNSNHPQPPTHPGGKPGDSSNYMLGDNKYTDGGGS